MTRKVKLTDEQKMELAEREGEKIPMKKKKSAQQRLKDKIAKMPSQKTPEMGDDYTSPGYNTTGEVDPIIAENRAAREEEKAGYKDKNKKKMSRAEMAKRNLSERAKKIMGK